MLRQHASGRLSCFKRIDIDELYRRWRQRDATAVLDVRDDQEWASGHIPGAQHLHVGDVPQHLPCAIAHDAQHCHRIGDFDARLRGPLSARLLLVHHHVAGQHQANLALDAQRVVC